MDRDKKTQASANKDILFKDLKYKIIDALYKVHKELGPGHNEDIYHKAIARELENRNINFKEKEYLAVEYKGQEIGEYKSDFIIEDKVILEIKVVPVTTEEMFDQTFYYLKGANYKLMLLANFSSGELVIKQKSYA